MNSSNTNSFSDLGSPSGGQGAFFRGTGGFKIALRNMNRNKSYAFINVLGLSVGIASCLLIFLVLQFETSFDTFHKKKDYIYRIGSENHSQDGLSYSGGAAFPVGPALRIDFPQIKVASIFRSGDDQVTIINEGKGPQKKFTEDFYFTEPQFF
ncbi:MAG: ABC transporter permease, partial [Flavisolibacter sp.]|nr:ABC transporter permease [Flavisolibacter sp.]